VCEEEVEVHPLQAAISFLLILAAAIVLLTAFQASTEVIPDLEVLADPVYYEGKRRKLVEAMVEEVDKMEKKGVKGLVAKFLLKNAKEYLKYEIWGAAALGASRAYKLLRGSKS